MQIAASIATRSQIRCGPTAPEHVQTIHSRDYSATREEAMADFKKQWLS